MIRNLLQFLITMEAFVAAHRRGGILRTRVRSRILELVTESWLWARLQVLQNSGGRMFILRIKTVSTRDCHWLNPREKNYRERNNIKVRVSVHWRAQCHAKWPRGSRKFQHPAGIEPTSQDSVKIHSYSPSPLSDHRAIDLYLPKKWYIARNVSQSATMFLPTGLLFLDCSD